MAQRKRARRALHQPYDFSCVSESVEPVVAWQRRRRLIISRATTGSVSLVADLLGPLHSMEPVHRGREMVTA
jgi:hypothetical protein